MIPCVFLTYPEENSPLEEAEQHLLGGAKSQLDTAEENVYTLDDKSEKIIQNEA